MGTYAVKIESLNYFAVYHSTTETMYSPTWDEDHELEAHVFARIFGSSNLRLGMARSLGHGATQINQLAVLTDAGQGEAAARIRAFFDEKLGEERILFKFLPEAWCDALDDIDGASVDLDDLTSKFEHGKSEVEFILDELFNWKPAAATKEGQ